MIQISH